MWQNTLSHNIVWLIYFKFCLNLIIFYNIILDEYKPDKTSVSVDLNYA